jgi:hypothetical protein
MPPLILECRSALADTTQRFVRFNSHITLATLRRSAVFCFGQANEPSHAECIKCIVLPCTLLPSNVRLSCVEMGLCRVQGDVVRYIPEWKLEAGWKRRRRRCVDQLVARSSRRHLQGRRRPHQRWVRWRSRSSNNNSGALFGRGVDIVHGPISIPLMS